MSGSSSLTATIKIVISGLTSLAMLFGFGTLCPKEIEPRDEVKNVIFFIGDGMGENHLKAAEDKLGIELAMETATLRGQSETRSWVKVTDSAAGATALACGVRTINGYVGVYGYDPLDVFSHPMSLTELAMQKGMATGIVTTDSTSGATPAGFSTHTYNRGNNEIIAGQQLTSDINLIWGLANGVTTEAQANANGFEYVDSSAELAALDGSTQSFGQFNGDLWDGNNDGSVPTLSQMTEKAIDLLDDDNNGFFVMIEGAHIDKFSHGKNIDGAVLALEELDKSVAYALEYAETHEDTLVIVTADHETGSVQYVNGEYVCTTGSHSASNVPLLVYGSDNFITNGSAIKNTEVFLYTAMSMGFDADELPQRVWFFQ